MILSEMISDDRQKNGQSLMTVLFFYSFDSKSDSISCFFGLDIRIPSDFLTSPPQKRTL